MIFDAVVCETILNLLSKLKGNLIFEWLGVIESRFLT